MKRDIKGIVRDLDNKKNNDIIYKKDVLLKMFNEDPDLKDVLRVLDPKPLNMYKDPSNPTEVELKKRQEIVEYNEKIQHEQIVPFLKLNGLQKEVLNFVMFDIRDDGTNYYNDTIKKQYIEVMCLVHEEDRPYIIDADYYCRKMRFLINAPNVVNGHMGRLNKYDNFKI